MNIHTTPSPNHNDRQRPVRYLVLHYTGMHFGRDALKRLCDPASGVSAHYIVLEDGETHQMVADEHRAWHAGLSYWEGERDINSASIGIEIANGGHDENLPPYPALQLKAVQQLCLLLIAKHSIKPWHVLAHSDIAPTRKQDPGEHFPWPAFAEQGIGLWPEAGPCHSPQSFPILLDLYGYDVADLAAATDAFHRRFYPERLSMPANTESARRLGQLLAARFKATVKA
jgi:N-acetylmuramoyl-L-alanine amidase